MEKNVQDAIKEIKDFLWRYECIKEDANMIQTFFKIKKSKKFKDLESIYNVMAGLGFTRKKFIDKLCEEVVNGKLSLPDLYKSESRDIRGQITGFVDFYYVNLDKYENLREQHATCYIRESEELVEWMDATSKLDEDTNHKKKSFFPKLDDKHQNAEIEDIRKKINDRKESLKYLKKFYDSSNEIVEFLLELDRLYPQFIMVLSIENNMSEVFYDGGYKDASYRGYEDIEKEPNRLLESIRSAVDDIIIPTGEILNNNSYLKTAVSKMKELFVFLELNLSSSQLVSYDEYLSNPEFIEKLDSITTKEEKKNKK